MKQFLVFHIFRLTLVFLLLVSFDYGCSGVNYERKLVRKILEDYDISVRPSRNVSHPLNVTFGLSLTQIIDVDERNQILTTNCWLNQMWIDYSLQWNASHYGGIKVIRIPADKVWRPDIILYNNADSQYNLAILSTNVIVSSDGNITWLSTGIFKSSCQINVEYFPFDEQTCVMKFASWSYDGFQVNLVIQTEDGDLSNYVSNGEWDLIKMEQKRHVVFYSCCTQPYPDITFSIVLRRRPLFYDRCSQIVEDVVKNLRPKPRCNYLAVFNLILPCVLISGLALLSFYMPSDSGEKVTLGITTLLSMTVFLMVIGESMPPTSEKLPLIGLYYGVTITLVSLATGLSVVTLNIHHRGMRGRELPSLMRTLIFSILSRILFLRLDFPKRELGEDDETHLPTSHLADGSSTGLLSRKLSMGDTWRVAYPDMPSTPPHACSCESHSRTFTNSWQRSKSAPNSNVGKERCGDCCSGGSASGSSRLRPIMKVRGIPSVDGGGHPQYHYHQRLFTRDDSSVQRSFSTLFEANNLSSTSSPPPPWERRLSHLLNRVVITMEKNETRMSDQDKKDSIKLEWQQAALIIDRLLLWIFVIATVSATFGILYMSPHTKLFTS